MATLGKGVGYLVPKGRLQMWPIRGVDDAKFVAKALFDTHVGIAEPYFFNLYNSIEAIFSVLNDDKKFLTFGGYVTARKAVVAAILLGFNEQELSNLIRSKMKELAQSAENDSPMQMFQSFLMRLRERHPEVRFRDPFYHS